eukprot:4559358-Amphidinium_carterae.1
MVSFTFFVEVVNSDSEDAQSSGASSQPAAPVQKKGRGRPRNSLKEKLAKAEAKNLKRRELRAAAKAAKTRGYAPKSWVCGEYIEEGEAFDVVAYKTQGRRQGRPTNADGFVSHTVEKF